MALKIIWNDIRNEPCDVIVTPASRKARPGSGLDGVIHKAAGEELLKARKQLGPIGPGIVKVTDSFNLKKAACRAKHVIHALGPVFTGEMNGTERPLLLGCYLQVLCTAASIGAKTVSMPVMSSGKFGMPMDFAMDVAVEAITLFLQVRTDMTVKLVGVDSDFHEHALRHYQNYLVEKYDTNSEYVYRQFHSRKRSSNDPDSFDNSDVLDPNEQLYFKKVRLSRDVKGRGFKGLFKLLWERVSAHDRKANARSNAKKKANAKETTTESLRRDEQYYLISRQKLATRSGVTPRYLKRLCSNERVKCTPSRDVVLALAVAMRLDLDYTAALLKTCGEVLGSEGRDAIISDFIVHGDGDVKILNQQLYDHGFLILKPNAD